MMDNYKPKIHIEEFGSGAFGITVKWYKALCSVLVHREHVTNKSDEATCDECKRIEHEFNKVEL